MTNKGTLKLELHMHCNANHAKFQGVEVERVPPRHPADCPDCPVRALFRLLGSVFYSDANAIEVTDFKSVVGFDLRGCFEAVVASEAAQRAQTI